MPPAASLATPSQAGRTVPVGGTPSYGDMPSEAKLRYALDAALGLADMHNAGVGDLNTNQQYLTAANAAGNND